MSLAESTVERADFYSQATINAGVAAAIYKATEALSTLDDGFETYTTVVQLLHGMVFEPKRKAGYREPFLARMWQQITINIRQRHYPVPLKAYLQTIGYHLASGMQLEGWVADESERIRKLLYVDLRPLFEADAQMINRTKMQDAMLPGMMRFSDGKFYYTFGYGKGEEAEIGPPAAHSGSAVDDVDPDESRIV